MVPQAESATGDSKQVLLWYLDEVTSFATGVGQRILQGGNAQQPSLQRT